MRLVSISARFHSLPTLGVGRRVHTVFLLALQHSVLTLVRESIDKTFERLELAPIRLDNTLQCLQLE